jgi:DNA-binding GntR family transcriptional regulator
LTDFAPIRANLGQQVFEHLRERIYRMEIEPGTRLGVGEVADELGVSRSPVRDAFLMLIAEGIVETMPSGAYQVIQFNRKYIDDVFVLRRALELAAVRLCGQNPNKERVLALYNTWELLKVVDDTEPSFLDRHVEADNELHQSIAEMSQNLLLKNALDKVVSLASLIRRWQYSGGSLHRPLATTADEHLKILDALLAHDVDSAIAAMDDHLAFAHARSLARLDRQASPTASIGNLRGNKRRKGGRLAKAR